MNWIILVINIVATAAIVYFVRPEEPLCIAKIVYVKNTFSENYNIKLKLYKKYWFSKTPLDKYEHFVNSPDDLKKAISDANCLYDVHIVCNTYKKTIFKNESLSANYSQILSSIRLELLGA